MLQALEKAIVIVGPRVHQTLLRLARSGEACADQDGLVSVVAVDAVGQYVEDDAMDNEACASQEAWQESLGFTGEQASARDERTTYHEGDMAVVMKYPPPPSIPEELRRRFALPT